MTIAMIARPLPDDQRSKYERAVLAGRAVAERGSSAALKALGELPAELQHSLTAFGGDWNRLVEEVAYTHWHRVLFARFLIENDLLMNEDNISLSLDDCAEIAHDEKQGEDAWDVAARHASAMLPGIFRPASEVAKLRLAAEHRADMQRIVAELPRIVFTSSDSLGWSYQYWQSKRKDEINASEVKIGGAQLPAVTQLFTEPYMVDFLVHNTLGAWWAMRHPDSPLVADMEYLRGDENGEPSSGTFDGWPDTVAEVTAVDPSCGSGHFLTTLFHWLRLMREEAEGKSPAEAGDAVLRDNLNGLELDERCIQIAHFNLAMHAWLSGGYRALPQMRLACTGVPVKGTSRDWLSLAKGDTKIEEALQKLHALLENAEHLGSLVDPNRETGNDLLTATLEEVMPVLRVALERGVPTIERDVYGRDVLSAGHAVGILAQRYHLVITNVPYLSRGKQVAALREYCARAYPLAQANLATTFLERCVDMCCTGGTSAVVTPGDWITRTSYRGLRAKLLVSISFNLLARLGSGAFRAISGEVVAPALIVAQRTLPEMRTTTTTFLDVSRVVGVAAKAEALATSMSLTRTAEDLLANVDHRITMTDCRPEGLLANYAKAYAGIQTGDYARFGRCFWEWHHVPDSWRLQVSTVRSTLPYGGREHVLHWGERGEVLETSGVSYIRGREAWDRRGVLVSQTGRLKCTLYEGELCDDNAAAIIPDNPANIPAIWAFLSDSAYNSTVREIDDALKVTNATLVKVPFDLAHWQSIADVAGPLPTVTSDDPSQWLFAGRPSRATAPLHVAVARLVGYRWPAQFADDGDPVIDDIDALADEDGIVCLPSVRGELSAADRLRNLLAVSYGDGWTEAKQGQLLAQVNLGGGSLDGWLRARTGFAAQHNRLFHNRPFIWQITDGLRDGFSALVNYHKLDRANLDRLTHSYLPEWITNQQAALEREEPGADKRLAAATKLKAKLELIAKGQPPYDVYVRWKRDHYLSLPQDEPPSWDPDLDDGVRMNIRPFVLAGVLHANPNVHWKKDRGRDPDGSDRINDLHYGKYKATGS